MASKSQIIITGKVDELPPVNNSGYPTARLKVNRPPLPSQMLAVQLIKNRLQLAGLAFHTQKCAGVETRRVACALATRSGRTSHRQREEPRVA
jgi:hypothetical protein